MVHYHIRWPDLQPDWQVFIVPEDARVEAERLVRPGESYTIDSFTNDCPKCAEVRAFAQNCREGAA